MDDCILAFFFCWYARRAFMPSSQSEDGRRAQTLNGGGPALGFMPQHAFGAGLGKLSAYYLQSGAAGKEALFAESFANYCNADKTYFSDKPRLLEFWKSQPKPVRPAGKGK